MVHLEDWIALDYPPDTEVRTPSLKVACSMVRSSISRRHAMKGHVLLFAAAVRTCRLWSAAHHAFSIVNLWP